MHYARANCQLHTENVDPQGPRHQQKHHWWDVKSSIIKCDPKNARITQQYALISCIYLITYGERWFPRPQASQNAPLLRRHISTYHIWFQKCPHQSAICTNHLYISYYMWKALMPKVPMHQKRHHLLDAISALIICNYVLEPCTNPMHPEPGT